MLDANATISTVGEKWDPFFQAQAELDADSGASTCKDYFIPKEAPGKDGFTAVAICDQQSGWLAGHVVDSKGSGTRQAVEQVLRDLRRMGHHGKIVVKTDQEAAIMASIRVVAQQRGESRTVFETSASTVARSSISALILQSRPSLLSNLH